MNKKKIEKKHFKTNFYKKVPIYSNDLIKSFWYNIVENKWFFVKNNLIIFISGGDSCGRTKSWSS